MRWLHRNNLGWSSDIVNSTGSSFVMALTDCLWYIDGGHTAVMESRSCKVPLEFAQFTGYNIPEKSKHRKREAGNLSADALDSHSTILNKFLLQPWFERSIWKPMKSTVCILADALAKYALYLQSKSVEIQGNHEKTESVRSVSDAESFCFIERSAWVKPTFNARFKTLQDHLDSSKDFEPLFVTFVSSKDQLG